VKNQGEQTGLEVQERRRRQQAEEALRKSEQNYREIFNATHDAICVHDAATGEILNVNQAMLDMYGCSRADLPNLMAELVCSPGPYSHEEAVRRIRQAVAEGPQVFEWESKRKSGERFWVEVALRGASIDGKGCVLAVARDITERKRLEEERELSLNVLARINSSPDLRTLLREVTGLLRDSTGCDAVGIRLRDGEDFPYYETAGFPPAFVTAENKLCATEPTGELRRDSQGSPVLECMCGNILCGRFDPAKPFFTERGSFWTNSTTKLLASTTEADRQAPTRNRCNREGYESVALIPVRTGGATFGLLQFNDMRPDRFTPEKIAHLERIADHLAASLARWQAEQAREQSDASLRLAAGAARFGTYSRDFAGGTDRSWSPELRALLGTKPNEELPLDKDRLIVGLHPEDRPAFLAARAAAEDPLGDGLFRLDFRILRPDGSVRWFQARGLTSFAGEGKARHPDRAAGVVLDITERKLAEAELDRSRGALRALTAQMERAREEERSRLAREIHDELGHAMTDLKLDLGWLARRLAEAGISGRSAIRKRIAAMGRRAEAAAQTVRRIATDLRPAVLDALGLAATLEWQTREFQERTRIRCEIEAPGGLPRLDGPKSTAMFRIFQETLSNVARHARASHVQVRLTEQPGRLVLRVCDNGRGMTEAERSSPTALGLLGMRERAAALGGDIAIASAPGRGTTITVSFPVGPL
jgi:PAS domain S-box-containing protein